MVPGGKTCFLESFSLDGQGWFYIGGHIIAVARLDLFRVLQFLSVHRSIEQCLTNCARILSSVMSVNMADVNLDACHMSCQYFIHLFNLSCFSLVEKLFLIQYSLPPHPDPRHPHPTYGSLFSYIYQ